MNGDEVASPVAPDEQLARFVLFSSWIRGSGTVKPDAFIPHPHTDLSVTRLLSLSEQELWQIGQGIADARPATLHGRADIQCLKVQEQRLGVEAKPVANNPNHANIIGWPAEKPAQKIIAQLLAAASQYVKKPG